MEKSYKINFQGKMKEIKLIKSKLKRDIKGVEEVLKELDTWGYEQK